MKLKNKIALTVIPSIIAAIVCLNAVFAKFFKDFVLDQESARIGAVRDTLAAYIGEKRTKYTGNVNDWAHWDDTYYYIQDRNAEFSGENLTEATYENLDLSFMFILDARGRTIYGQYRAEGSFSDFPEDFIADTGRAARFSQLEADSFGIFRIGNQYYIVSSSSVTDSLMERPPDGTLIFGRLVDAEMAATLESISGCSLDSIETYDASQTGAAAGEVWLEPVYDRQNEEYVRIRCVVPNAVDAASSIRLNLTMRRDLYTASMKSLTRFAHLNTLAFAAVCMILFLLLGRYLSKPFAGLIRDVGNIDLGRKDFFKLPEKGHQEFVFLRRSINSLLYRIERDQRDLIANRERLRSTLLSVGDGVIAADTSGKVEFMNPAAEKLTGWNMNDAIGLPIEDVFDIVSEATREPAASPVKRVFETDGAVGLSDHTLLVSKNGTETPIEDTAAPIRDADDRLIGCVLVFRDFSERKEKQRRIEYLSYHDQLTGLYNRRFFEEELRRLDVERNLPLSFIYADVNGLKTVNDAFGHQRGDHIIRKIAGIMKSECRADEIIARTGGDEFILLLPKTDAESAQRITRRIKSRIDEISFMDIKASVAFGWDTKVHISQNAWDVLKNAEDYMYKRKILGGAGKRNETIRSIMDALLAKSPGEKEHSAHVSRLCESLGRAYGLGEDDVRELRTAGELHDIGKIAVDESILRQPWRLSESDWDQVRRHPETGYRLLGTSSEYCGLSEYVLAHHERWDGGGYPRGLSGESIPWKARVISVADAYDAMTSERPYRSPMTESEAVREIGENAGTQFDPDIARTFVEKVLGRPW